MSRLGKLIGFLISVIILLFLAWGGTELMSHIFSIDDSGTKTGIRWSLLLGIFILGAIVRHKTESKE